jgi:hypothetical protein
MSHVTGTVQVLPAAISIGPDSGAPPTSAGVWAVAFNPPQAPGGTRLLILHFRGVALPAANRLEVDLGYGTDVFTSSDGPDFWTRPVNVYALSGAVPIRYVTAGSTTGGVQLDRYGRGERHAGEQDPTALSNCDPFLGDASYVEPEYDPFWFCTEPPSWENMACVPIGDLRRSVARSVGMIMHVDGQHLSTCTVTLIEPDLVLTAGHCMVNPVEDARSGSVIFGYEVNCDGTRPAGYAPTVVKVKEVVKQLWDGTNDYCLVRLVIPSAGLGLPAIQMRHDIPAAGEKVFGVHHPNGAVKKLSIPHPGYATVVTASATAVTVPSSVDVSGGSSGSALFDAAGRAVGVLSFGDPCMRTPTNGPLRYFPTSSILQQIAKPPVVPPIERDVVIVLDRSGSMSLAGASGRRKIDEARDAASLFVQLVRAGTGNRVGMVSFATAANSPPDVPIAAVTQASKATLVGPPPFSGGAVGALVPGGATSIGSGLDAARAQMPQPVANPRALLLLTDGLQNTPPLIEAVEGSLGGIDVQAVGYGTPGSLDGSVLTALAAAHGGTYVRADTGLRLEKFFAQAFGAIFEAGLLTDPEFDLPAGQSAGVFLPFSVCDEETVTVVIGWDRDDTALSMTVRTPAGVAVGAGSPGVEERSGRTWSFLRITLPHQTERQGTWAVEVFRPGGELPPPSLALRYFVSIVAGGGPRLTRLPEPDRHYTGDPLNPLVLLKNADGTLPEHVRIQATVTRPDAAMGTILSGTGLVDPLTVDADTIPARQATILQLEAAPAGSPIGRVARVVALTSDPVDTRGAFEAGGLFGVGLRDSLQVEGDYTFHVQAQYGDDCIGTREALWSMHVDVGIDPSRTGITTTDTGPVRGGRAGRLTVDPRDVFGNRLGPGRSADISIDAVPGTTVTGAPQDNGDGTYTISVEWDPAQGPPGIVIGQPDRPPVVVRPPAPRAEDRCRSWRWLCATTLFLALAGLWGWLRRRTHCGGPARRPHWRGRNRRRHGAHGCWPRGPFPRSRRCR